MIKLIVVMIVAMAVLNRFDIMYLRRRVKKLEEQSERL